MKLLLFCMIVDLNGIQEHTTSLKTSAFFGYRAALGHLTEKKINLIFCLVIKGSIDITNNDCFLKN